MLINRYPFPAPGTARPGDNQEAPAPSAAATASAVAPFEINSDPLACRHCGKRSFMIALGAGNVMPRKFEIIRKASNRPYRFATPEAYTLGGYSCQMRASGIASKPVTAICNGCKKVAE